MADEPVFPKPRARPADSAYRSPAERPVEPAPRRVEVSRPEPPPDDAPRRRAPSDTRELLEPLTEERAYWARQRFAMRYPRISGLALLLLAGAAFAPNVHALLHGGYVFGRAVVIAPGMICAGLWMLAMGGAVEDGRAPPWWHVGLVTASVCGLAVGLVLLATR